MRLIDADALKNKSFRYVLHRGFLSLPCIKVKDVDEAPTVDAVPVPTDLKETVLVFLRQYEQAKQNEYVRNPIAYALYHAWKEIDEGGLTDGLHG
ncbi:MAG: hypothetical protein KBS74_02265 [Clostridiales bacterium]|nr:hypothetical protein [Candidatus Cacconaster stercorequi]